MGELTGAERLLVEWDELAYWETWRLEHTLVNPFHDPEATRLPYGTTETLFPERHEARAAYYRRVSAAYSLSDDPDVVRALIAGEKVPEHVLDARYRLLLERWAA